MQNWNKVLLEKRGMAGVNKDTKDSRIWLNTESPSAINDCPGDNTCVSNPAAVFHSFESLWSRVRNTDSVHALRLSNKSTGNPGLHKLLLSICVRHNLQHTLSDSKPLPKLPAQFRTPKADLFTLTEALQSADKERAQTFQVWAPRILSNYGKMHSVLEVHRK